MEDDSEMAQPDRFRCAFVARFFVAAFLLVSASCSESSSHLTVVPVKGKVMYQGKPLEGAHVIMSRVAEATPLTEAEKKLFPQGVTREDGTFQLTSYTRNDGAPPGRYTVGVMKQGEGTASDDKVNLIPGHYASPKTSGLIAIVKAPATELPDIVIKDK
jgi:hypothetical protein